MSRKKKTETLSLFGAPPRAEIPPPPPPEPDIEAVQSERKLRIVPKREDPEEDVIIEPTDDGRFLVHVLRNQGTTCAAVFYTRYQLQLFLRRIPPALEVG